MPINIIASDHSALGCKFVIEGRFDAGVKIISGAITLAGCKNVTHKKQIKTYVKRSSADAGLMVKPHCGMEKLIISA